MYNIRALGVLRSGSECAPPHTPAGVAIGTVGKSLSCSTLRLLHASSRSGLGPTNPEAASPSSSQPNKPATTWGAAIASKAPKIAAGQKLLRKKQERQLLESVEAIAVNPDAGANASAGPVVVVQPEEPSSPRSSQLTSDGVKSMGGPSSMTRMPPAVSFVRPPGQGPAGRSTIARSTVSERPSNAALRKTPTSSSRSRAVGGPKSAAAAAADPFSSGRGAARPQAAVPSWLVGAATKRRPAPGSASSSASAVASASKRSATDSPPASSAATAAATAATAAAATDRSQKRDSAGDHNPPLAVSFSQVMGRGKRVKDAAGGVVAQAGQDTAEEDVVDYTWEPHPDLDVVEDDAAEAAAAEARRREEELKQDATLHRRKKLEAAEEAVLRSYAPGAQPPPSFVGSVRLERIQDRGFGLVADEELAPGQLLLISRPALCERGPPGKVPPMRPIMASLLRLLRLADGIPSTDSKGAVQEPYNTQIHTVEMDTEDEAADGRALASMYWGAPRPPAAHPLFDLSSWRGRQRELLATPGSVPRAKAGGGGNRSPHGLPLGIGGWPMPSLMSLLQLNLVAESTQDGAAAGARCEALSSVTGIWPEVALINHSCAPNAVAVLLHDRILVRACRRIPRGREILLCWLSGSPGPRAPCLERRELLQQMYQFTCSCARCRLESAEFVSLPFMYSDAERAAAEPLELLHQALEHRSLETLNLAIPPLQDAVTQLASAIQLLGEQVDLTGGRETMVADATMGMGARENAVGPTEDGEEGEEEQDEGGGEDGGGSLRAAAQKRVEKASAGDGHGRRGGGDAGKGTAGAARSSTDELGPVDRHTAEAWLLGGMLPLHETLIEAMAYRAAWLGMDLGPGWHWPPQLPAERRGVGAMATSGVAVESDSEDSALEEQQAEAMAELIGSLASYVDVVAKVLPGSETHTQATARLMALGRRFLGPMDRVSRDINTATYDAHVLRYGDVDEETFERLLEGGIQAMDAACKREAAARQTTDENGNHMAAADGEDDVEQAEALAALFDEDHRLREANFKKEREAAQAAKVRPSRQSPRSGRVPGRQAIVQPLPPLRYRSSASATMAEVDEETELPEGIEGSGGSGGHRRRRVMAEADEDLKRILQSSSTVGSTSKSASSRWKSKTPPRAAVAPEDDGNEEAVRRLFLRDDAVPRVSRSAGRFMDDDDDDVKEVPAEEGYDADVPHTTGRRRAPSVEDVKKKFDLSLDSLRNIFPGMG